jgi:hypothetical protein
MTAEEAEGSREDRGLLRKQRAIEKIKGRRGTDSYRRSRGLSKGQMAVERTMLFRLYFRDPFKDFKDIFVFEHANIFVAISRRELWTKKQIAY